jgi:hypothetical protein
MWSSSTPGRIETTLKPPAIYAGKKKAPTGNRDIG